MFLANPSMSRTEAAAHWRLELGKYLRCLREAKHLTQAELCDSVDLHNKQVVSAVETGRLGLPSEHLEKFANAFGVPRHEFAKQVLRFQDPWMYACLFGADDRLRTELVYAPSRVNHRQGPRHSEAWSAG